MYLRHWLELRGLVAGWLARGPERHLWRARRLEQRVPVLQQPAPQQPAPQQKRLLLVRLFVLELYQAQRQGLGLGPRWVLKLYQAQRLGQQLCLCQRLGQVQEQEQEQGQKQVRLTVQSSPWV